jgi:hypothetical protein
MIVFDLHCGAGHVFEAWLASSATYETQRASGLLACPMCGSTQISKAVMAPAVAAKGNQTRQTKTPANHEEASPVVEAIPSTQAASSAVPLPVSSQPSPEAKLQMAQFMTEMAQAQARALADSRWVGGDFAEQARAMHYGEADHAPIHGTTSPDEARALAEEGLPVAALPFPVIPPGKRN